MQTDTIVSCLFNTIRERAVDRLRQLRDASGQDLTVATRWADDIGVPHPKVIAYAVFLRDLWASKPKAAARLSGGIIDLIGTTGGKMPEAERAWLHFQHTDTLCRLLNFPDPARQTRADWLRHAKELYDARAEVIGFQTKATPRRRDETGAHVVWFVAVHINGELPADVASREGKTAKAVTVGVDAIAAALGVKRRRGSVGRPRKKEIS